MRRADYASPRPAVHVPGGLAVLAVLVANLGVDALSGLVVAVDVPRGAMNFETRP